MVFFALTVLICDQVTALKTEKNLESRRTVIDYYSYQPRPVDISSEGMFLCVMLCNPFNASVPYKQCWVNWHLYDI